MTDTFDGVVSAEVVLSSGEFDADLEFFTTKLKFRLEAIFPADQPRVAVLCGHGLRVRLDRQAQAGNGRIRLHCRQLKSSGDEEVLLTSPGGTQVELVDVAPPVCLAPHTPSYTVSKLRDDAAWSVGRAGMEYRDLLPTREGGRFVASHIRIRNGGPVPDYVHFHRIRFQMIYCYRGWVRLVYEGQGPAFVMRSGDCVLQPPEIRHRVLEASDGLEVIEIGSPAEHLTCVDHDMALPTDEYLPGRCFDGQQFVFHKSSEATWGAPQADGFEQRDLGIATATRGLASVVVHRRVAGRQPSFATHNAELLLRFVLRGGLWLHAGDHEAAELGSGDCFALPAGTICSVTNCSDDLELLEVRLPAARC